ncbi:phosphopyruvate hydratase [Patescibacteria group bacterium]|nr:phosphopyruvate hydratase [Patescibacteria group bacterium]MBU0777270.1 phosphopyruvate hydratase [Patescibacteria group bacterium]MBU0845716.1 phosphopyruvate hydratase [Patescibacteria group bacterium]MBU0923053.1 phosphopyruvate hydratase [Patescibacteria group bacterium]MBU1066604.1 phosphopyruvate hydratase [Patescibacteria group bacterium]
MAKITKIWAREILDSRAVPTVEAACQIDTGHVAVASVPSGASTGTHEALELRDKDPERYRGKGVLTAVSNVNKVLGPALVGMDPTQQEAIDAKLISLDGTENKTKYGGNAILAISEVVSKIGAMASKQPLYAWVNILSQKAGMKPVLKVPTSIFNMINGGLHGAGNLDFQEFHVIPASSKTFAEGLRAGAEIYVSLGENLARRGAIHSVGDEGGYAPNLFTNADALEIVVESINETSYSLGRDVSLGLDVAASEFYKNGEYSIRDKSSPMDETAFIEYYKNLNTRYHLAILEDPLHEDAWDSWKKLSALMSPHLSLVGDDLLATNPKRVQKAIDEKACNAILIKPNQIGTITETLKVIKMAKDAKWKVIVSHRSGETNDWFIADFAVGVGAEYVKFGAPARGERIAKYNRLTNVETEILRGKV